MYYLAVDIGASSGRHILGSVENGKITIEEVYRFKNGNITKNGHLCWDIDRLFSEIKNGMKKCAEIGKKPVSMGIDCFGVDFVLLDKNNNILGDTVAYRDSRTEGMQEAVFKLVPERTLYERTGLQSLIFNTIYQLYSVKTTSDYLDEAVSFMQLPDYFHFLLTGVIKNEFTNGSTTQLINAGTKNFDGELLDKLGIPKEIFQTPSMPGTLVGKLKEEIQRETGLDCEVVLPATHDTAAAVMAVPTEEECIYISSGTWSLMGTLLKTANTSVEGMKAGLTNEGAYDGGVRYLKNIMGLWIIQSIRKEINDKYTFNEMSDMAIKSGYSYKIDVNDNSFLAPSSMIDAIRAYLKKAGAPEPSDLGDILCCVYNSLASCYAQTVTEIEEITGKEYSKIHIIGGGCKDTYLNSLTAKYTGKEVYAGPVEATAIGNLMAQLVRAGEFNSVSEAKEAVAKSFDVKKIN